MGESAGVLQYDLTADLKDLDKRLNEAEDKLEKSGERGGSSFASKLGSVASAGLKVGLAGVTAGFAALTGVAATSVGAFMESENAVSQLNAVLKSTKGVAGVSSDALQDYALELQNLTGVSDEAVIAAQSMLLTFTGIKGGVFKQTTQAALDMATAMNGGVIPTAEQMRSTAMTLGKALNDPLEGLTKLSKQGVVFSAEQEKMIRSMVAANNIAGAQKVMLEELQVEYGGSAVAAGQTFAGQLNILKENIGGLQETLGQAIIGGIQPFIANIVAWAQSPEGEAFVQGLADRINYLTTVIFPAIFGAISTFIGWLGVGRDKVIEWWGPIANAAMLIGQVLKPSIDFLWGTIKNNLLPALQKLWETLAPVLIPTLKVLGVVLGAALIGAIEVISYALGGIIWLFTKFLNIITSVVDMVKSLVSWLNKVTGGVIGDFVKSIGGAFGGGRAMGGSVQSGTTYLVGEKGPELYTPKSSGTITNAGETANILGSGGGGGITINVGSVDDASRIRQIANAVEQAIGRNQNSMLLGAL